MTMHDHNARNGTPPEASHENATGPASPATMPAPPPAPERACPAPAGEGPSSPTVLHEGPDAENPDDVHPELQAFIENIPWHVHLGIRVLELRPGYARLLLPYQPHFTGNATRGALHGGVMATLADSCGNAALWTSFGPDDRTATIDLAVDYFRPAPLADLVAEADVRLLGNRIGNVHVRIAPADDPAHTVAEGRTVCYVKRMS